jgi:ATP-binding cassette, subfamily B, bacterial
LKTEGKLTYFTAIRFLSKYILKYKSNFVRFYFGWLFDSIISVLLPLLFGLMIDEIVYRQNMTTFLHIGLVVAIVSLFSMGLYFLIYAQHHFIMNMFSMQIKRDIFSHLMKSHANYLVNANSGELVSCLTWYPLECVHFIVRGFIHQINRILVMSLIIICLFKINIIVGIIVLIMSIVIFLLTSVIGEKTRKHATNYREHYGVYIGWLFEILKALRDIRILNAVDYVCNIFSMRHEKLFAEKNELNYINTVSTSIVGLLNLMARMLIYCIAGYLAYKGNLTIGTFLIILTYYNRLQNEIVNVNTSYLDAQNRISFIQKVHDFLHAETEDSWQGKEKLNIANGNVAFHNVNFSYTDNKETLRNFELEVAEGEKFALVGGSGCGKTTVAHLLIGLFKPQGGEILIDGKNIETYTLKSLRSQIGILEQEVLLFDGSIRYNLLLGNPKATEEEISKACEQAGILSYINDLPNGFYTILGKDGIGLSGGQKQRLGIARLYLRNPKIIIFDEATSALDEKTEKEILSTWNEVLESRTSIVIAHKQSAVMLCNRGGIIQNGHIISTGYPDEMGKYDEEFRLLFAIQ